MGPDFAEVLVTSQPFSPGSRIDEQLGGEQGENYLSYSAASSIIKYSHGWGGGGGL